MLKRFLSYYKPHIKLLVLDMLAALTIALIGMVYPLVTNKMLNVYIPEKMYKTPVLWFWRCMWCGCCCGTLCSTTVI